MRRCAYDGGMGHGHGHAHAATGGPVSRRPLVVALCITAAILVVEVVGAVISGSLALLADAGHMLTDVAGLTMAVVAATLASRATTPQRTWGYLRAEVLGAAAQAALLLGVGVFVLVEGVRRLFEPPEVASGVMIVFGLVGLLGNAASIAVLARGRSGNLNTRAAFLEVVNDALGSVAVLVAAVVIATTGWLRADALVPASPSRPAALPSSSSAVLARGSSGIRTTRAASTSTGCGRRCSPCRTCAASTTCTPR